MEPKKPEEPAPKPKAAAPAAPAAKPEGKLPPFDERYLKYSEVAPFGKQLDPEELVGMLRDGRPIVRANAALGLAAVGHPALDLVTMLRDSDLKVASAAAEAVLRLGTQARPVIPQISAALDSAVPEVTDVIVGAFAELVSKCDDELISALDVTQPVAMKGVVEACVRLEKRGVAFLVKAAAHERSRIRINAIGGLAKIGKVDFDTSMGFLTQIEANDSIPDVRTAAKQAMLAIVAREKSVGVDIIPKNIPDFEARKLSHSELAEYANEIDIDVMAMAMEDGRAVVKINAGRALAVKGPAAARAARAMGLQMRDSVTQVRRETAKSLGKLGAGALDAAPYLVKALDDTEVEVAEAAVETLAGLGAAAEHALFDGLATGDEAGGWRVGELIAKLPNPAPRLAESFRSPAVNVQVNAAHALGMLGKDRVGPGLQPLLGARTGGDARTRAAVRKALDMIDPRQDTGPKAVQIDGFEERFLAAAELEKHKAELERVGVADFIAYIQGDGRDAVRANAATALGVIGPPAAGAARSLGVRLRDDNAKVRLASAQALDRIGDAAVVETGDDLVGALRDADEKIAATCAQVLRARKGKMVGALLRGLETDDPRHGKRIAEVINVLPDASEILGDAFESPAVNVQVNAALALGMLGKERVGKGRKLLEGARTGGWERTREAVRKAIEMLDGPRRTGPDPVAVDGFETKVLGPEAFSDAAKLKLEDLVAYTHDGRAVVRANAATALGAVGAPARGAAVAIGVLCRDDDNRVRIAAAHALDRLGDDAVKEAAEYLVSALRGDADVAKTAATVLGARKARVLTALLKGLETDDDTHARRILDVINALPDACEILCDAFESPAENVQVNCAIGIGMLGAKRAGAQGKKVLEGSRTGGFARTREAVFKGLAMLKEIP